MNSIFQLLPKFAGLATFLALPLGIARANFADSSNVTVDTRDIQFGVMIIQGPASIAEDQQTSYAAMIDGVDVSSQCIWRASCSREIGNWWQYPSFLGNGLLDPKGASIGDTITISARISSPEGDTRQTTKSISLTQGGGLKCGISQDVRYLGSAGGQYDWSVAVDATGSSVDQPGITFAWTLDGEPIGTTRTLQWDRRGLPGIAKLRLVATDGQGRSGEQTTLLPFQAPSPGEPGQRYEAWRKQGVHFLNKSGNPMEPDPAKKKNGLIVLTHGLRSSPYEFEGLAADIESRLAGAGTPNVVIFGWSDDANPSQVYATAPERLETISSSIGLSASGLHAMFPNSSASSDFLFDAFMIREVAKNQGRSSLAKWIRDEESLGNISKTAPIHLIGHSAGGFVMGECYKELRPDGFNIRRVTMLDTPFAQKQHVDIGNPAVIERYVSSLFGQICPEIDMPRWDLFSGWHFSERQDSAWYHRLDVGTGGNFNPVTAHSYSYQWYDETIQTNQTQEGFQLSPFVTGSWIPAPLSGGPQAAPIPMENGGGPEQAPLPPTGVIGFATFGNVTGTGTPYVFTENSNAGIVKSMTLSPDASGLTFQYQFTSPGDGDFLVVYFGDSPPLFIASPTASNTDGVATAEISLAPYAGQTGDLVIKLVAQDTANAVLAVDNIQMTLDDDIDGDGISGANELIAGTDPRFADTDGDGIDDPTELNTTLTNPLKVDSDGDGTNDGSEMAAGTDPLDGSSSFAVKSSVKQGSNFTVTWSSVAAKQYRIVRSPEPDFGTFDVIASGIAAVPPQQSFTDTGGATGSRMFYRVELEP